MMDQTRWILRAENQHNITHIYAHFSGTLSLIVIQIELVKSMKGIWANILSHRIAWEANFDCRCILVGNPV